MIDGRAQPIVSAVIPELGGLDCIRKQPEQVIGSQPVGLMLPGRVLVYGITQNRVSASSSGG